MAIMEAAISSALSHPNIVQTFTYSLRSVMTSPDVLALPKDKIDQAMPMLEREGQAPAVNEISTADTSPADSLGIRALEVGYLLKL